MKPERIARILYNMALDMDYADSLEESEQEISALAEEIKALPDSTLLHCLENIAMEHEDMEFWKEGMADGEKQ